MNKLLTTSAALILFTLVTGAAHAGERTRMPREFNKTITREMPKGTFTRNIEQHRIDNGVSRSSTLTAPDGRTATREMIQVHDRESKTVTREVSGTRLNGDNYSGESITTRTDNGRHTLATRTNADGQTASRETTVVVDKVSGTATKEITLTNYDGQSHSKTVVIERPGPTANE